MVAELSALQQIVNALTGLNGLPVVIVECIVTTIYTCTLCRYDRRMPTLTLSQRLAASASPLSRTASRAQWSLA